LTTSKLNPAFDAKDFLANYWQKKPLYIPQLIPGFQDPISPEELAGLAMETDCESRLLEGTEPDSWELSQGPFAESRFTALPNDGWTLLVQAVDQWNEPVFDLKQLFQFLPQWRIEDVMVSFAANGAGVGPHFDYYDVFLVQGSGTRNWQVGPKYSSKSALKNCSGLSILEEFEAVADYTLQAGDALYVPPQYAHWGKSQQRSMCYSIGCRAPSTAEILEGYSDSVIDRCEPEDRYTDPTAQVAKRRGEIDTQSVSNSFNSLMKTLDNKENYYRWFGQFATRPKIQNSISGPEQPYDEAEVLAELADSVIAINPSSRFSFLELEPSGKTLLFVDGESIELAPQLAWYAHSLCQAPEISKQDMKKISQAPESLKHTLKLLNQGSLISY
jgi:50S ribosomal protein L16 3-hydroxylase